MLVVDATVVVEATVQRLGLETLAALNDEPLVAPWLLWSEVPSALSAMIFRREISSELGEAAIERFRSMSIDPQHPSGLIDQAWRVARDFGWARTYDAEYVALAKLLGCRLVTLDGPLWRRSKHLGFVITPAALGEDQTPT